MNWGHSSLAMKSMQFDLVKIEPKAVKAISAPRKINAIMLNIKIN